MSVTRTRSASLDEACVNAADLARAAAAEVAAADRIGDHAGIHVEDERVVTHLFSCTDPAYAGWRWAVTVSRAARAKVVTVSEVALLPGPESLLAPDWVPWSDRVRPGDLGVGDLMPAASDDDRLIPAVLIEGEEGVLDWDDSPSWDLGNALARVRQLTGEDGPVAGAAEEQDQALSGRARVLSAVGRDTTAGRWYASEHGPGTPLARAAPGPCLTCGFVVPLGGPLGRVFGVCANEFAPDDGRVVSLDHGCGAHSEALPTGPGYGSFAPVIDEVGYDLVDLPGVALADTVFESLDHADS